MSAHNAKTAELVTVTVVLTKPQAFAFAQHLKRACFADYRDHAVDQFEAYTMIEAGEALRESLARAGFAPR